MKSIKLFFVIALLFTGTQASHASTVACTTASENDFVPSFGQVYVGEDQYSRFIYQWVM